MNIGLPPPDYTHGFVGKITAFSKNVLAHATRKGKMYASVAKDNLELGQIYAAELLRSATSHQFKVQTKRSSNVSQFFKKVFGKNEKITEELSPPLKALARYADLQATTSSREVRANWIENDPSLQKIFKNEHWPTQSSERQIQQRERLEKEKEIFRSELSPIVADPELVSSIKGSGYFLLTIGDEFIKQFKNHISTTDDIGQEITRKAHRDLVEALITQILPHIGDKEVAEIYIALKEQQANLIEAESNYRASTNSSTRETRAKEPLVDLYRSFARQVLAKIKSS